MWTTQGLGFCLFSSPPPPPNQTHDLVLYKVLPIHFPVRMWFLNFPYGEILEAPIFRFKMSQSLPRSLLENMSPDSEPLSSRSSCLWTSSSMRPRPGFNTWKCWKHCSVHWLFKNEQCSSAVFGPTVYQGTRRVQLKRRNTILGISYRRNLIEISI